MTDGRGDSSRLSDGNWMTDTGGFRPVGRGAIEAWLRRHADLVALAVLAVGLVLRLRNAVGTWLNPDEALIFLIANQPSLSDVCQHALTNAHPPLFYLLLHLWQRLGDGELALRLLPVLAGTATVWVVYRWLARISPTWGLTTAGFLAVLPAFTVLDAEVRQYALLMLLVALALLAFDRSVAGRSAAAMGVSVLLLCASLLTHYAAFFIVAALGAVGLAWIAVTRPGRRLVLAWGTAQLGVALVGLLLVVSHIALIRGSEMEREAHTGWLRGCFFDPVHDNMLRFTALKTGGVFSYIFASRAGAVVGLGLFVVGILMMLSGRLGRKDRVTGRCLGATVLLCFALTVGAAGAGLFPFCGSRHTAFLGLLALPVACLPIVWAARGRLSVSLLAAAVVAVSLRAAADRPVPWITRANQSRALMEEAIAALRQCVPPGAPVVVDYQTAVLLGYYLKDGDVGPFPHVEVEPTEVPVGGLRMLVWSAWDFNRASLELARGQLAQSGAARPGQLLWVMDAGGPQQLTAGATTFGDNIALFTVEVPSPRSGV